MPNLILVRVILKTFHSYNMFQQHKACLSLSLSLVWWRNCTYRTERACSRTYVRWLSTSTFFLFSLRVVSERIRIQQSKSQNYGYGLHYTHPPHLYLGVCGVWLGTIETQRIPSCSATLSTLFSFSPIVTMPEHTEALSGNRIDSTMYLPQIYSDIHLASAISVRKLWEEELKLNSRKRY